MHFAKISTGISLLVIALSGYSQTYKISDHWKIGGQGGWDYALSDDESHRLYVTHNARIEVLDTATGKLVGAITGLKSTHGIALNRDGKTGYASDGAANAIVIFDRKTLTVIATVPAGTNPDGIAYEPGTNSVWAFNGRSHNVTVLDATNHHVVATIPLPGKPEFPQVDGEGNIFVNIEDQNTIVKLNAHTKAPEGTWKLPGCESPSGMAIDRSKHRLFSVCDGNKMAVVDYTSGKELGLAKIGDSPDAAAFDPKTGMAFSSNGDGTLSVVDTNKPGFPTVETVKTARGARTMAFDAMRGKAFLPASQYGPVPAPTSAMPHPRPVPVPESFEVLVVTR